MIIKIKDKEHDVSDDAAAIVEVLKELIFAIKNI